MCTLSFMLLYAIWFAAQDMCNYLRDHLMSGDFDTTGSTLELGAGTSYVGLMLQSLRTQESLPGQGPIVPLSCQMVHMKFSKYWEIIVLEITHG